jgi:flagellar hook protein FlgE
MAFNIGLSGIRAASVDLEVTGNNVANASTVGFKESRAEFADVYTTTILGTGTKPVGSGVLVDNVRQEFSQGNISGTENALDMAIDGNGFFILSDNGTESYTRAGIFGLDKDGFVVANNQSRLQGYEANDDGVVNGVLGDLQIRIGNQPPALTSRVAAIFNLDASEQVKQELGSRMTSTGLAVGTPDSGIADNTASVHSTIAQPTTAGTAASFTFDGATDADLVANTAAFFATTGYPTAAEVATLTIDPQDGTAAQTITIGGAAPAVGAVPPSTSQTVFINNLVADIQSQLDATFGPNEFEVSTAPDPIPNPLVGPLPIVIERSGHDSTIGTGFAITGSSGDWDTLMGSPLAAGVNFSAGVAGSNLFVGSNPIVADFRSIPGTSTTTRTVATPPLAMTDTQLGGPGVLSSTVTPGASIVGDFSGAESIVFDIEVTDSNGTTTPTTITLDNASLTGLPVANIAAVTIDEIRQVINAQVGPEFTVSGAIPLTLTTAAGQGNGATITLVPVTNNTYDLSTIGFAPGVGRSNTGTPDVLANNEFRLQVTGPTAADNSNAYDIIITPNTYATLDDLAAEIQDRVNDWTGANGLQGRVSVSAVGGQLVFTNTDVGSGYGIAMSPSNNLTGAFGAANAQASLDSLGFNIPADMFVAAGTDTIDRSNSFRINLTVPAPDTEGRSGTTTITLDEEFRSVQQLAASINRQISSLDADAYIGVRAEAIEIEPRVVPPEYKLQFVAVEDGEASIISISEIIASGDDLSAAQMYGLLQVNEDDNSLLTLGIEGVNNEYPAQKVTLTDPDGQEVVIETEENAEANEIAAIFNRQAGITASASTTATIPLSGYNNPGNNMTLFLNGQELTSTSLEEIAEEINLLQTTTLPGFKAEISDNGDLVINNSIGRDIKIEISSPTVTDSIVVTGSANAGPVVLGGTATADVAASVGGTIEFIINEGYSLSSPVPAISGVFGALTPDEFEDYVLNSFNPKDQNTYNHATSSTIYDSLGNGHILTQFFVKEPIDPTRPNEENLWVMYVQIDGQEVGDPDSSLPFPENLEPTRLRYELFFNPDGTLDEAATGDLFVTNWDPVDSEGAPTGSLKSLNVLEGGLPLTDPPTNSNFEIVLDGSTQFGDKFSSGDTVQNGYTTGRLTGLEIDADGFIFARFTNGQAQVLGQVALASFKNPEGLIPLGDTAWGESFESGGPTVGSPRTGTFGNLRSSALEDSNVDLSEELVGLIIAQRNFQASAKTIETSDTVTQTIIQL